MVRSLIFFVYNLKTNWSTLDNSRELSIYFDNW